MLCIDNTSKILGRMLKLDFLFTLMLVSLFHLPSINAGTCEETETAQVKLDLAKQSISSAKLLYPKCQDEKTDSNCSEKDRSFAHLNAALDLISEAKITCHSCPETNVTKVIVSTVFPEEVLTTVFPEEVLTTVLPPQEKPLDCSDVQRKVSNRSGVYKIWPRINNSNSNESIEVYCDMETEGGGWTVIQRRGKFTKQIDFFQDWETYKKGFGNLNEEFWLGNENIYALTNQDNYSARFDLVADRGEYRYAQYKSFRIGDEKSEYVLSIMNHTGNISDDMRNHHNSKFSTKDRGNDGRIDSCAEMYHSAFWYNGGCGLVSLNGIYQPGKADGKGIWWYSFRQKTCLSSVEIKIRRP